MKEQDILDQLWVEKYRPRTLDEMVLSEKFRSKFETYITKGTLPNLLFASGPGTGKSSIARILSLVMYL